MSLLTKNEKNEPEATFHSHHTLQLFVIPRMQRSLISKKRVKNVSRWKFMINPPSQLLYIFPSVINSGSYPPVKNVFDLVNSATYRFAVLF